MSPSVLRKPVALLCPNRPKRKRFVLREFIDICIEDGTLRDEAGQSTIFQGYQRPFPTATHRLGTLALQARDDVICPLFGQVLRITFHVTISVTFLYGYLCIRIWELMGSSNPKRLRDAPCLHYSDSSGSSSDNVGQLQLSPFRVV